MPLCVFCVPLCSSDRTEVSAGVLYDALMLIVIPRAFHRLYQTAHSFEPIFCFQNMPPDGKRATEYFWINTPDCRLVYQRNSYCGLLLNCSSRFVCDKYYCFKCEFPVPITAVRNGPREVATLITVWLRCVHLCHFIFCFLFCVLFFFVSCLSFFLSSFLLYYSFILSDRILERLMLA
jgi:hypothetical protein